MISINLTAFDGSCSYVGCVLPEAANFSTFHNFSDNNQCFFYDSEIYCGDSAIIDFNQRNQFGFSTQEYEYIYSFEVNEDNTMVTINTSSNLFIFNGNIYNQVYNSYSYSPPYSFSFDKGNYLIGFES